MNCLDCAQTELIERPAIGVCTECGAAVCADHSVQSTRRLTRQVPPFGRAPVDPPARVLRCLRCQAAHDAARDAHHGVRHGGAGRGPVSGRGAAVPEAGRARR